jgi:hypothetical protein
MAGKQGVKVFLEREISAKVSAGGGLAWKDLARKSEMVVVLGGDGTMLHTPVIWPGTKYPFWASIWAFRLSDRSQPARITCHAGIDHSRQIPYGKKNDA